MHSARFATLDGVSELRDSPFIGALALQESAVFVLDRPHRISRDLPKTVIDINERHVRQRGIGNGDTLVHHVHCPLLEVKQLKVGSLDTNEVLAFVKSTVLALIE